MADRTKKLQHFTSARHDPLVYLLLLFGAVFMLAGVTVDPATNCDASGRECAPWLVPIAFCMGVLATVTAVAMLVVNRKWGSRLDLAQRRLFWWDDSLSQREGSIALDDVVRVEVQRPGESNDRVFLFDRDGALILFPSERALPYDAVQWARDLASHFPHIEVEVKDS